MSTFSIQVVRFSDGSVDRDSTLERAEQALDAFIVETSEHDARLASVVGAVFDKLNGARANMPYVVSQCLSALGTKPEQFKQVAEDVANFIRASSGTRASGAVYRIAKGKGGGVSRWRDVPLKEGEDE